MSQGSRLAEVITFFLGAVLSAFVILGLQWLFPAPETEVPVAEPNKPVQSTGMEPPEALPASSFSVPAAQEIPPQIPAPSIELDAKWEPLIMEALKPRSQGNSNKNQRLIQIAVVEALGVPAVQETCLRHLTFSLSNEEAGELYKLAVNQGLPLSGRRYLVDKSLRIRSPEVAGWLAGQLARHPEPEIARLAARYLEKQQKTGNAAAAGLPSEENVPAESKGPF